MYLCRYEKVRTFFALLAIALVSPRLRDDRLPSLRHADEWSRRTDGSEYFTSGEKMTGCTRIRFAVISDTQRWYDEAENAVSYINARGDIDFVLHCGDISDFGLTREMEQQRDIFQRFEMPYFVALGNHDCVGTGLDTYQTLFGNPNFSFTAGDTHVLCLNTNALEFDYATAVPDFDFIRADRASLPSSVRRTVVMMHAMPRSEQFNNSVSDVFAEELGKFPDLQFCLCGHGHTTLVSYPTGQDVPYYECGSAVKRKCLIFTLNEDGSYDYENVGF